MHIGGVLVIMIIFNTISGSSFAQGPEMFYPPKINGKLDLQGLRFVVRDEDSQVRGNRPNVMRKGFILKIEAQVKPLSSKPLPISGIVPFAYYLTRAIPLKEGGASEKNDGGDDDSTEDDNDTMIRYVRTLNDLRGFVKIRTETDALEFLRFGSSLIGYQFFDPEIREVYCIRAQDTILIHNLIVPKSRLGMPWTTEDECRRLNFPLPKILNPLIPKENRKIDNEDDDDNDGDEDKKGKRHAKSQRFFLIERTVHAGLTSSLTERGKAKFFRILEEVGPEGQWRIISKNEISVSAKDHLGFISR